MKTPALVQIFLSLIFFIGVCGSAYSASMNRSTIEAMKVPLYKSHIVSFNRSIKKISVGNPDIADILIMRDREVYVLGKALGTTNVLLWDKSGNLVKAFDVEVTHDLRILKEKLHDLLPEERIEVSTSQGAIVLSGQVSNVQAMNTAYQIAQSFSKQDVSIKTDDSKGDDQEGLGVINLLSVGDSQQVMLKVTVAEIERSLARKWDMEFNTLVLDSLEFAVGAASGGVSFPDALFGTQKLEAPVFGSSPVNSGLWGPAISEIQASPMDIVDKGIFGSQLTEDFFLMFSLEAAKNSGMAKILAEPTLTTLSGQDASFLAGGEFPIPVTDRDGVKVSYKEFGVGVKFLPTVLANDRIHLDLNISVSEVNSANSIFVGAAGTGSTYVIPSLTKRSAKSHVELADGQTIAIAGLMNENMRDLINKFPLLGDIPVLGSLFRSKDFKKGETELMILVTPVLAKPIDRNKVVLPTDGYVEPNDLEFYVLGKGLYKKKDKKDREDIKDTSNEKYTEAVIKNTEASVPGEDFSTSSDQPVSSGRFGHVLEGETAK